MTPRATSERLRAMLAKSPGGISAHTETLKVLIEAQNEKVKKEHCKGMEGLAAHSR